MNPTPVSTLAWVNWGHHMGHGTGLAVLIGAIVVVVVLLLLWDRGP